jgi:hypothetical protein
LYRDLNIFVILPLSVLSNAAGLTPIYQIRLNKSSLKAGSQLTRKARLSLPKNPVTDSPARLPNRYGIYALSAFLP